MNRWVCIKEASPLDDAITVMKPILERKNITKELWAGSPPTCDSTVTMETYVGVMVTMEINVRFVEYFFLDL